MIGSAKVRSVQFVARAKSVSVQFVQFIQFSSRTLPTLTHAFLQFLGKWFEAERFFVSYESLAGRCWGERYILLDGRVSTLLEWRLAL